MIDEIRALLREAADRQKACAMQRFFKTGPGEYGEGDVFIGVRVPAVRDVARKYRNIPIEEILILLRSRIHEERLLALVIMVERFKRAGQKEKSEVYEIYLDNRKFINNWDLVDVSAEHIVGGYLFKRSRDMLYELAESENLWVRRISVISTFYFIRRKEYSDTLKIAGILIDDREDLIHKAAGWMLREIGNRERNIEERFLRAHYKKMPRTMLRYAIEKFPENLRKQYLKGEIDA